MRTKDLKAGKEYATCNGELAVIQSPVHANYYFEYDRNKNKWVLRDGGDPEAKTEVKGDPWAGCHKPKANQPRVRRMPAGVKVKKYLADRDGRRINDSAETAVVRPRDIAGPWKEYLTLYADVVREAADRRERQRADQEFNREAKHLAQEAFGAYGKTEFSRFSWSGRVSYQFRVTVDEGSVDEFIEYLRRRSAAVRRAA